MSRYNENIREDSHSERTSAETRGNREPDQDNEGQSSMGLIYAAAAVAGIYILANRPDKDTIRARECLKATPTLIYTNQGPMTQAELNECRKMGIVYTADGVRGTLADNAWANGLWKSADQIVGKDDASVWYPWASAKEAVSLVQKLCAADPDISDRTKHPDEEAWRKQIWDRIKESNLFYSWLHAANYTARARYICQNTLYGGSSTMTLFDACVPLAHKEWEDKYKAKFGDGIVGNRANEEYVLIHNWLVPKSEALESEMKEQLINLFTSYSKKAPAIFVMTTMSDEISDKVLVTDMVDTDAMRFSFSLCYTGGQSDISKEKFSELYAMYKKQQDAKENKSEDNQGNSGNDNLKL